MGNTLQYPIHGIIDVCYGSANTRINIYKPLITLKHRHVHTCVLNMLYDCKAKTDTVYMHYFTSVGPYKCRFILDNGK